MRDRCERTSGGAVKKSWMKQEEEKSTLNTKKHTKTKQETELNEQMQPKKNQTIFFNWSVLPKLFAFL